MSTEQLLTHPRFSKAAHVFQSAATVLVGIAALTGILSVVLALFGVLPWLGLEAQFGDGPATNIGVHVQIGLTVLLIGLIALVPSGQRVMSLERVHRDFKMTMEDVSMAYHLSHAADRAGTFKMAAQFDDVRDRLSHMRSHPDLSRLEPEVLDLAAQMSHTTRDLAAIYSDEKLTRARTFLQERERELTDFEEKVRLAISITEDIKSYQRDLGVRERNVDHLIALLKTDLREVLPDLGIYQPANAANAGDEQKVVAILGKDRTQ
ncbi:DNA repair protein [Celeribacter arenosi]|uniref:DNA repair protein n=1 Tax=Celeribacter arenosi TaxID=792649 RepID=A0ABP7KBI5_9RHOB